MKLMTQHVKTMWLWTICLSLICVAAPSHASKGKEIRVQGPNSTYKIAPTDDEKTWNLKGPGMNGFSLQAQDNGSWVVLDPAKTIRQKTKKTNGRNMEILDPEGKLRHTVEFISNGFKVIYPDGKLLCRIMIIDEDNFQIFNTKNSLIMTGRAKGKAITVKDVTTKQRLFKIKGKLTIEDGAFFSIPLQFTETVVIWKTATQR